MKKYKLYFYGGAGAVTGANFLFEGEGIKILVDCGLHQGSTWSGQWNRQSFQYNPAEVDYLFVTHAHADHIGRIPKLVKDGFRGKIFSTHPTKDLAPVMFDDMTRLMARAARERNQDPMYDEKDVSLAMSLWESFSYHETLNLKPFQIMAMNAGHILGSAMYEFDSGAAKIVFTGDLGNSPSVLLPDTESVTSASYMVMESVYGNRNHEGKERRGEQLKNILQQISREDGTLIMPVFSLERTQVFLHEINSLVEKGEIGGLSVFLDSPLAIKITHVYKKYSSYFKEEVRHEMERDDIFDFPKLRLTMGVEDSAAIKRVKGAKIILAGSGMSDGGRVVEHLKNYLEDSAAVLLFSGYQAPGTTGRLLQDGAGRVEIQNNFYEVKMKRIILSGYSSHKDSEGLERFASEGADSLRALFLAMGEPSAAGYLAQKLRDNHGINAIVPELGYVADMEL